MKWLPSPLPQEGGKLLLRVWHSKRKRGVIFLHVFVEAVQSLLQRTKVAIRSDVDMISEVGGLGVCGGRGNHCITC